MVVWLGPVANPVVLETSAHKATNLRPNFDVVAETLWRIRLVVRPLVFQAKDWSSILQCATKLA